MYFKDPKVATDLPGLGIDMEFDAAWEPGLTHGPTSARFAVVDWDETIGKLTPPAQWDARKNAFVGSDGRLLDAAQKDTAEFRQVSTWARLQNTLETFESGSGLGRRLSWGFEGNRLIVVPQAGYGKNAYYDRASKSLQFYYFDKDEGRVYTCLSADIVTHEFGHALLDGIRPYYLEAVPPESAAFHEFMGDLTAILMVFRNNSFREGLAELTDGNLDGDTVLSGLAQQFGSAVSGRPYLRNAAGKRKMSDLPADMEPHDASEVLTSTVFEIIQKLSRNYPARRNKKISVLDALWYTIQRVQTMAIQALDFLPRWR